jgi:oligopeptide transport system ATP-binding protein
VTIQAQIVELIKQLRDEFGMAIIWITHDLGVVAGIADTIQVMYGGQIMERGDIKEVFGDTRHPYTEGLLKSLPRLDRRSGSERLVQIEGSPPDMRHDPVGCPFAPRCPYVLDKCWSSLPSLDVVNSADHTNACWVDVKEKVVQSG